MADGLRDAIHRPGFRLGRRWRRWWPGRARRARGPGGSRRRVRRRGRLRRRRGGRRARYRSGGPRRTPGLLTRCRTGLMPTPLRPKARRVRRAVKALDAGKELLRVARECALRARSGGGVGDELAQRAGDLSGCPGCTAGVASRTGCIGRGVVVDREQPRLKADCDGRQTDGQNDQPPPDRGAVEASAGVV